MTTPTPNKVDADRHLKIMIENLQRKGASEREIAQAVDSAKPLSRAASR